MIFSLANIITTSLVLPRLASSSVWPVNDTPPSFINFLFIGHVTTALNSFDMVFLTDSSKIDIMYLAVLGSGLPDFTSELIGLSTTHKDSSVREFESSPVYSFILTLILISSALSFKRSIFPKITGL